MESQRVLSEMEQRLVFERKMEIFQRIREWRFENERLGIAPDLTDTWTPEQRERFLRDWQDEELPMQGQKRSCEEMGSDDEPQIGRGQDVDNAFTVESTKQVNVLFFEVPHAY